MSGRGHDLSLGQKMRWLLVWKVVQRGGGVGVAVLLQVQLAENVETLFCWPAVLYRTMSTPVNRYFSWWRQLIYNETWHLFSCHHGAYNCCVLLQVIHKRWKLERHSRRNIFTAPRVDDGGANKYLRGCVLSPSLRTACWWYLSSVFWLRQQPGII